MTEYDFTTGTKLFLIATFFIAIGLVLALLFETTGTFGIIFGGTTLGSLAATYAAATYMSVKTSAQKARFVYDTPREGSAALIIGLMVATFGLFPLILVLLSEGWDNNVILSALIGGVGGFLALVGAFKANMEWEE
ncbi:MAG: hypothetical protein MUP60_03665 [Candidatus Thorarchaeota archaeon]|nr:hypothetical protein [Candidatus Thorarchaeota archaeon]